MTRHAGTAFAVVPHESQLRIAEAIRRSVLGHPPDSTCACTAFAAIGALMAEGYEVRFDAVAALRRVQEALRRMKPFSEPDLPPGTTHLIRDDVLSVIDAAIAMTA